MGLKKFICILILGFVLCAQPVWARPYGPLWKVYTHSRDRSECNIKTAFWFVLSIAGATLVVNKINKRCSNRIELTNEGLTIYWKK